jgi:MoaA/NifB/PqqE/SkfB family radical SAM enzyme
MNTHPRARRLPLVQEPIAEPPPVGPPMAGMPMAGLPSTEPRLAERPPLGLPMAGMPMAGPPPVGLPSVERAVPEPPATDGLVAAAAREGAPAAPDVHDLLAGDSFCIKPWVHCHVTTLGDVRPCCISPVRYGTFGRATLDEIWQGDEIRRFRAAHLSGKKVAGCERCYDAEKVGAFSMRKNANEYFAERARLWVETTTADGSAPLARPVDYDIRFSNICNFKCRSCYHASSSSWYKDHVAIHGTPNGPKAIIRAFDTSSDFWAAFGGFVDEIEKIYFAGGEPLLQDEHYQVLRALHERERHDVFIFYNTNFSSLDYRGTTVTELWRHFKHLTVAASLDSSGARAELMRHGQSWQRVLDNRERLRRECPSVDFRVACTVSALNVWHLPEFHRELIDTGFIEADQFDINIAHYPPKNSAQVLPLAMKREVDARIVAHVEWLRARGEASAADRFAPVREFLWAKDGSAFLRAFREYSRALDGLRGENTAHVFPELASILDDHEQAAAE